MHDQSDEILKRYLLFHAVVYYYEYAVGAIRSQEKGLQDHEPDGVIVGSAVSAYMHMGSCLKLLDSALGSISKRTISNSGLKRVRASNQTWRDRIRRIRHRVAAHPEEDRSKGTDKPYYIMSKRSGYSSDGTVELRQIAMKKPRSSSKIMLTPRQDLEALSQYLERVAAVVRKEFEKLDKSALRAQ